MSFIFSNFVVQFDMILEKQVELLLLIRILDAAGNVDFTEVNGKVYNVVSIDHRVNELLEEFLNPYVIENAPKGE